MVKIGRTIRDSRLRARELFTSGIPTPFQVAFEIFSDNCEKLESDVHKELDDFRISNNREFFRYPVDKAITLLVELNSPPVSDESVFQARDISEILRQKYPGYLKPDIVAVRIVQPGDRVWLEITQEKELSGYLKDQTITRTNLGFIAGGSDEPPLTQYDDTPFFRPEQDVRENARKFVDEFDPLSIIMTTELFNESACDEISKR